MARWSREEIEQALDKFRATAFKGAQTGNWREWANCFTQDATYFEHHYGRFWGRENIYKWISKTMSEFPPSKMTAFPMSWHSLDLERGWVFCEVMNRMEDLGDGKLYQEPNLTILHYAGGGLFSYEEDAYNPANMAAMIKSWLDAGGRELAP